MGIPLSFITFVCTADFHQTVTEQTIRLKISQLVNKMCSHQLFPVVDKSGTSCYHLVTRLMEGNRLTTSCSTTSLISSARNKLITRSWTAFVASCTTCSKSVAVINLVPWYWITTSCCCRLIATTGNKQCEHILTRAWLQSCCNLFANL